MSLELTKYKRALHAHISVAGDYTDTFIEVQSASGTSTSADAFVKWVPHDKNGTYLPGVDVSNLDTAGYLRYDLTTPGYTLFRFKYFDNSNARPGIQLVSIGEFDTDADGLAAEIDVIFNGGYGDTVFVIANNGDIASSPTLNTVMYSIKSWQHTRSLGTGTSLRPWTYTAVGTNVNSIGLLSESLSGYGTHANSVSELAIEHDSTTLGHAGYGEEFSSGIGAGEVELNSGAYSTQVIASRDIYWNNNNQYKTEVGEHLRGVMYGKVGQGAGTWNGYYGFRFTEQGLPPVAVQGYSVDGWTKLEGSYQRQSAGSSHIKIEQIAYRGSGGGSGAPYDAVTMKGLQVYKSGQNPDQARDVAVHKWHINSLNIIESPADFDVHDPDSFYNFYSKSRNLADTTINYTVDTANSNDIGAITNYQSNNGTVSSTGIGRFNYVQWFDRNLATINDSTPHIWVKELRDAAANQTKDLQLGWSAFGIPADHTKTYIAGCWVRVREMTHTGTALAPCRISLTAGGLNGSYQQQAFRTHTGATASSNLYTNSVDNGDLASATNEWKLMSQFYLPSWMSNQDLKDWTDNYWATWAGDQEFGEGNTAVQAVGAGGLNSAVDGRIAGMTTSTTWIQPKLRVEWYSGLNLWLEVAYPFCAEIDPMNIMQGGDTVFWDFGEQ